MSLSLGRRVVMEAVGTALLLATAVGSGVMAQRLTGGNAGLALLACSVATTGVLVTLIVALGPWSGAHLNPVVSLTQSAGGQLPRHEALAYVVAQVAGATLGVWAVHLMFELPVLQSGAGVRSGAGQVFGEFVATFGLVLVIELSGKRPELVPFAVGSWIGAAYWFTSSTSFANPAATIARAFTTTPAGIRLADVPGFLLGEVLGAVAALLLARWLLASERKAS